VELFCAGVGGFHIAFGRFFDGAEIPRVALLTVLHLYNNMPVMLAANVLNVGEVFFLEAPSLFTTHREILNAIVTSPEAENGLGIFPFSFHGSKRITDDVLTFVHAA